MSRDAYELLALGARYVFAGLMVLIALRAARLTAVDSRRAAKLRRLSPMTGLSGELVVLEGDGKAPRGMRYPVIREGMIGSARSCDVRIRHASVRRRHACFQLTGQGLSIRDHAGARLRNGDGEVVRETTLLDGDSFWVGRIHLLLVLSNATAAQSRRAPEDFFATRREEEWDGEDRETHGESAAYEGEDWEARGKETAHDGEDWDARSQTRDFARAEARSRDDFDEEPDLDDSEPSRSRSSSSAPRRMDTSNAARMRGESRVHAVDARGSVRRSEDWGDPVPRAALHDSTFDGEGDRADSTLRTSNRTDAHRSAEREGDVLYSRDFSSARSASDDFHRASSAPSDLRSRDTGFRAFRGAKSPQPGIARDPAPRGDVRRSMEPSISREDRRSHASAPRGDGQRSMEPSISREDRRSHTSERRGDGQRSTEPSISREDRRSHASERRDGLKRSSQPRVREGIRREPEPPDDLFMDDL